MRKRLIWNIISIIITLSVFGFLHFTENWKSSPEKIASILAQGEIDITFKGEVSKKYMKILTVERTPEFFKDTHNTDIINEIKYFFSYFNLDLEIEEQREDELFKAFERIYSQVQYKIVKAEKKDEDIYISVDVYPINTMIQFEDEYIKIKKEIEHDINSGKLKATKSEKIRILTEKSLDKFFELSQKNIEFQDLKTLSLKVNKVSTGHFQVDTDSLAQIIEEIVPYKSLKSPY